MQKYISVTYKSLFSIVEAVDQKLLSDQAKFDASSNEEDRADLQNDMAFTRAYLRELKAELEGWLGVQTEPQ